MPGIEEVVSNIIDTITHPKPGAGHEALPITKAAKEQLSNALKEYAETQQHIDSNFRFVPTVFVPEEQNHLAGKIVTLLKTASPPILQQKAKTSFRRGDYTKYDLNVSQLHNLISRTFSETLDELSQRYKETYRTSGEDEPGLLLIAARMRRYAPSTVHEIIPGLKQQVDSETSRSIPEPMRMNAGAPSDLARELAEARNAATRLQELISQERAKAQQREQLLAREIESLKSARQESILAQQNLLAGHNLALQGLERQRILLQRQLTQESQSKTREVAAVKTDVTRLTELLDAERNTAIIRERSIKEAAARKQAEELEKARLESLQTRQRLSEEHKLALQNLEQQNILLQRRLTEESNNNRTGIAAINSEVIRLQGLLSREKDEAQIRERQILETARIREAESLDQVKQQALQTQQRILQEHAIQIQNLEKQKAQLQELLDKSGVPANDIILAREEITRLTELLNRERTEAKTRERQIREESAAQITEVAKKARRETLASNQQSLHDHKFAIQKLEAQNNQLQKLLEESRSNNNFTKEISTSEVRRLEESLAKEREVSKEAERKAKAESIARRNAEEALKQASHETLQIQQSHNAKQVTLETELERAKRQLDETKKQAALDKEKIASLVSKHKEVQYQVPATQSSNKENTFKEEFHKALRGEKVSAPIAMAIACAVILSGFTLLIPLIAMWASESNNTRQEQEVVLENNSSPTPKKQTQLFQSTARNTPKSFSSTIADKRLANTSYYVH